MQDASVALLAFAFTLMVVGSGLRASLKVRLGIFAVSAALVFLGLAVPIRLPVSRGFGDALDIVALIALAGATVWALFSRQKAPGDPEAR